MFVHQEQLEHLLAPRDYYDPGVHQREREALFEPGWHLLAARGELPRHGDFLTRDVLGEPVLLRNHEGALYAYRNVCGHRHCRLTGLARGHADSLRCQYHGWEYGPDGRTAKIPDARCFRPFDRDNAHLHTFRTATWGDMTFVSLADDGPSLAEFLRPLAEKGQEWLGPPFRYWRIWEWDYAANWKVVAENTLESYHVPCLHLKTLGRPYREEDCKHILEEGYTTLHVRETFPWLSMMQNLLVRSLGGGKITNVYTHHHAHPHLWLIGMDVMRLVQMVWPTSPTTCRHRVWLYTLDGTRSNPWAWFVRRLLRGIVKRTSRQVLLEDVPIFAEVQRGLEASRCKGVIGTREERIYAFQKHLLGIASGTRSSEKPLKESVR
jgi:phenylpropionate dioxygenase-like ring-hydroxylating dioxygenase large terminal subunit